MNRRQARRTIVFGWAMLFWAPVFATIYYLLGSTRGCLMISLAGVAVLAAMVSLRFTKSVFLTGHFIAGSVCVLMTGLATVTGGTGSPSLWWLTVVPIIGLVLCGVRSGVWWAGVSCLSCLAFLLLDQCGVTLPEDVGQEQMRFLNWAATSGIILCAFSLTLAFKLGEDSVQLDLESARLESEQANRAKSAFLANMSHEIRTPMNAVIGMTELVLGTALTHQQREYLQIVQQSSESLLSLLNDILDFSKIEADKLQMAYDPFDMYECLGDTIKTLGMSAHQRGIELICDIRPDVPRAVFGDPSRLRQIVVNLVGNAIKFTDRGEVVLSVRCEARAEKDIRLRFSVSDTGIGIPRDKQQMIFGLFEQADSSTTRRFGGTGLGLSICARLVQMIGGQLSVESEEGLGSTFHFTGLFGLANETDVPCRKTGPVKIRDTRVLVVDDNATNRRILEETLRSWGTKPDVVEDAHLAMGLLHHAHNLGEPYQLVLADAHMPNVDGFMLAQQIRECPELRSTIIVMLVSGEDISILPRSQQLNIESYVFKPLKPPELLDEMLRVLGVSTTEDSDSEQRSLNTTPLARTLQVLLVEDSLMNQKLAEAVLQKAGHFVTIANNGREALELWRSTAFDLILMDIQMPEMDGFEATEAIRQQEEKMGGRIPIIAMTAHALKGDRERCLDAGMDEYISKPIHAKGLLETMMSVV